MIPFVSPLDSTRVVVTTMLPQTRLVQFRFPRSKKRRIRKKWQRDQKNWKRLAYGPEAFMLGDVVYCSPGFYARLCAEMPALAAPVPCDSEVEDAP